jgi:N utilization substance protein A
MFDMYKTDLVPSLEPQKLSAHIEENSDAKRRELGVEDGLNDIPGVTTPMLVAFAEHGIRSVEDLADCATDDLDGWNEFKDGKAIRHTGILDRFRVSRQDCDAIIINARTKAGWFK